MKRFYITLLFSIVLCSLGWAQATLTVSNNPEYPAQYTSLQAAIDAANDADHIVVMPSPTSYGSLDIEKHVDVYGPGIYTNNGLNAAQKGLTATIDNITCWEPERGEGGEFGGADNASFRGFTIGSVIAAGSTPVDVDHVRLEYNYITGSIDMKHGDGWIVINNVFKSNASPVIKSSDFYRQCIDCIPPTFSFKIERSEEQNIWNNIFDFAGRSPSLRLDLEGREHELKNNLFLGLQGTPAIHADTTEVNNNIFYGGSVNQLFSGDNLFIQHNISFGGTSTQFSEAGGNHVIYGGNLEGVDPQFTNYLGGAFSFDHDYTLLPGSPAIGAGLLPAGDIGLTGAYSFKNYVAAMPQFEVLQVDNVTVPLNGPLQITIEAFHTEPGTP